MLQYDAFSAYNCEWLNQQTLEKTTQFCGPSIQDFNFMKTDSKFFLPSCQLRLPIAFSAELPEKKEPTLRIFWIQLCVYTLKMKQIGAIYWRLNPPNDVHLKHTEKWFGRLKLSM